MAALSAAAAVTIAGCGNEKAAATPPESGQSMTESAVLERALEANMDRARDDMNRLESGSSVSPAPPPQAEAARPEGLFYPQEWPGTDYNSLQAAAIWFYQNPQALDDPDHAVALIGLYDCQEARTAASNEVRRATLAQTYRARLRAWFAQVGPQPQAKFEIYAFLDGYDAAAGRFVWQMTQNAVLNLPQVNVNVQLDCSLRQFHQPSVKFTQPYAVTSPAFTPAEADAFITAHQSGRRLDMRVYATVPRTSVVVNGSRFPAVTPTRVAFIRP